MIDSQFESMRSELLGLLRKANDVSAAIAVLSWDQTTYMPSGGAEARARHIATLQGIAHEYASEVKIGHLLDKIEPYVEDLPPDNDDAALVRITRRNYERTIRVPSSFAEEAANHLAASYTCWTTAKPDNDFAAVLPHLQKTIELSRRYANFFPSYAHIADPLIDASDYGVTVEMLNPLFSELASRLQPLIGKIGEQPTIDDSVLLGHFPYDLQWAFGKEIIERLGYDFNRGRIDATHHPYMTQFSLGDVRITTRIQEGVLSTGLFGTIHEAGHGMYEQGINPKFDATPLAAGASSGIHESQSRLWENMVGRSLPFWHYFYPHLQNQFPTQFQHVSLDTFYRAINKVKPTFIRVEADELTYNLHIIIRFQLGLALLEGALMPEDLPQAWNQKYEQYLGITPATDAEGVLQDVHWYVDFIGGSFHGYTLGNILAAQFYSAAQAAHPEIENDIRDNGTFSSLHGWLQQQIYVHGAKYTAEELVRMVTGGATSLDPYLTYLEGKFASLYDI